MFKIFIMIFMIFLRVKVMDKERELLDKFKLEFLYFLEVILEYKAVGMITLFIF